ncbi:hypothetical protein MHU86_23413 [Fragilaria crotonensis]|nr:hypothetical protein MHU86_23413 [Fragilaria crotonensis]
MRRPSPPQSLLLLVAITLGLRQTEAFAITFATAHGARSTLNVKVLVPVLCKGSPNKGEDPGEVILQEELDAMMKRDTLVDDAMLIQNNNNNDEDLDERESSLYNAAPLVSGVLITGFSLFLTFYGYYAGITGTDPLFQQYPPTP